MIKAITKRNYILILGLIIGIIIINSTPVYSKVAPDNNSIDLDSLQTILIQEKVIGKTSPIDSMIKNNFVNEQKLLEEVFIKYITNIDEYNEDGEHSLIKTDLRGSQIINSKIGLRDCITKSLNFSRVDAKEKIINKNHETIALFYFKMRDTHSHYPFSKTYVLDKKHEYNEVINYDEVEKNPNFSNVISYYCRPNR